MVEIKRDDPSLSTTQGGKNHEDGIEDSKHLLLYSKSRVYVHPTGKSLWFAFYQTLNVPSEPRSVYKG